MAQRVLVDYTKGGGGYAYDWHGTDKLSVGDRVLVAGSYWSGDPTQTAVVTSTESTYSGHANRIIRKVSE